jgi:hypothetical protein
MRADQELTNTRLRALQLNLNVPLPALVRSSRWRLVPEVMVQYLDVGLDGWNIDSPPIDRVTRAGLELRIERTVSRRGMLLATLSAMSDLNAIDALVAYIHDARPLAWGVGAVRNVALEAELPIPVVYLRYSDGIATTMELLFPAHADVWFRPSERFSIGLTARLRVDRFDGRDGTTVDYGQFSFAPAARWHFLPGLVLQWEGGLTAGRVFDVRRDDTRLHRLAPQDAAFLTVRIATIAPS